LNKETKHGSKTHFRYTIDLPQSIFVKIHLNFYRPSFNLDVNSSFEYIFDHQINSLSNLRIGFKVILTSSNDMNDNNAWQKAQLFRQSIEQISDNDHSHCLRINLKIVKKWSISHTLDLIFATLLFQEFVHKHEDYFGRFFFSNQ
jgi:hypothetical protein